MFLKSFQPGKLLFFAFLTALSAKAYGSYSYAFLAIVGGGKEMVTYGGHAYLVFSKEKASYSSGVAYQYNLFPEEGTPQMERPFLVEKVSGATFVMRYRLQDRPAFLYRLKLSSSQIDQMLTELESERNRRARNMPRDYDFFKNNCLTTIVKHVNEVVSEELQFKTIWAEDRLELKNLTHYGASFMNAPVMAVNVLKNHPLVAGPPELVLPYTGARLKIGIYLQDLVQDFVLKCDGSEASASILSRLSVKAQARETEAYLGRMQSIYESCQTEGSRDMYTGILDIVWSQASTPGAMNRVDSYYP